MDDEYTERGLALKKESDALIKKIQDFNPEINSPKDLTDWFKEIEKIDEAYEDLIIDLNVEMLLINVHLQLMEEGYLKE